MGIINLRYDHADCANSIIGFYGDIHQSMVAVEELSELQKELIKSFRGKADIEHLTEELADVIFMLWQVQDIYSISDKDIDAVISKKCKRTVKRIADSRKG